MKNKQAPNQKAIQKQLENALLHGGKLSQQLYEHELVEHLQYWRDGLKRDGEDFVFVVTINTGDVAMLVIRKTGELLINEVARAFIQGVWMDNYVSNMSRMLPGFAADLADNCFALTGVKIMDF